MFHFFNKTRTFNGVAAGGTPSVQLETGRTLYRHLVFNIKENGVAVNEARMKTLIEHIELKINGITRFKVTGENIINLLMKYYGIAFTDGRVVIPFTRPWLKSAAAEDHLGWGMKNVSTFEVKVKLASDAVNPELTLDASVTITPEGVDMGTIVEVHEHSFATSVTGKYEIRDLPKGNGDLVALHFKNNNIVKIDVEVDKVPFIDGDLGSYEHQLKWVGLRLLQTGYRHIDALLLNRIGDAWPISKANSFVVSPDLSVAGSVPIIMETLNTPFVRK